MNENSEIFKEEFKKIVFHIKTSWLYDRTCAKKIRHNLWIVDTINKKGEIETVYIHESPTEKIHIQSNQHEYLGMFPKSKIF